MRGSPPFHACEEHDPLDGDEGEGRHGPTIPYAFANILTVNNAWSTSGHGRVLGRAARRHASAWRAQEELR